VTQDERKCTKRWDAGLLLGYLEGELDQDARRAVEEHLRVCPECRAELDALRGVDTLLKAHPDAFHPDESMLWRYAAEGADPDGSISHHLEDCRQCREEIELLRELATLEAEVPERVPKMPTSLTEQLERLHDGTRDFVSTPESGVLSRLLEWLRVPFRAPALSLGTAAAVILILVIALPMWRTYKRIPNPAQTSPIRGFTEQSRVSELRARRSDVAAPEASEVTVGGEKKALPKQRAPAARRAPSGVAEVPQEEVHSLQATGGIRPAETELQESAETTAPLPPAAGEPAKGVVPPPAPAGKLEPAPVIHVRRDKEKRPKVRSGTKLRSTSALERDKGAASTVETKKREESGAGKIGRSQVRSSAPHPLPRKESALTSRPEPSATPSNHSSSRRRAAVRAKPTKVTGEPAGGSVKYDMEKLGKGEGAGQMKARPAPTSRPRSVASRQTIPVVVRIIDSSNHPIPWLSFLPDRSAAKRYRFIAQYAADRSAEMAKSNLASTGELREAKKSEIRPGYLITIRVNDSGRTYNLDARLFEADSGTRLKGKKVAGVSREELNKQIDRLVRSLLDLP
jgi:hypothetical protein